MRVSVTFRHMEATPALREYAEEKVQHAERLLRNAIEAHVVLSVTKRRHLAEITLSGDHDTFNATEETGDLYSAIDQAIAKIERQIRKHSTRREARKHGHGHGHGAAPAPRGDADDEEPAGAKVRVEQVAIEPASQGEALAMMERQRLDALIFREPGSKAVRFVTRRSDGSFLILEPEGI